MFPLILFAGTYFCGSLGKSQKLEPQKFRATLYAKLMLALSKQISSICWQENVFMFLKQYKQKQIYIFYANFRTVVNFSARKSLFSGQKKIIFWWLRCQDAVITYNRRETWWKIKSAVIFDWTYHFPLHPHTCKNIVRDFDWPYNFVHVWKILFAPLIGYNSVAYKNSRLFSESISQ